MLHIIPRSIDSKPPGNQETLLHSASDACAEYLNRSYCNKGSLKVFKLYKIIKHLQYHVKKIGYVNA